MYKVLKFGQVIENIRVDLDSYWSMPTLPQESLKIIQEEVQIPFLKPHSVRASCTKILCTRGKE
uniref:Uncharacterized protein n=1 Tax=Rhizophora mucronata TaxID=61149 RepID=A0A2P2IM58_RHIMU